MSVATGSAEAAPVARSAPAGGARGPVAVARDLHVSLRRKHHEISPLRGIDLEIGAGEIVGLVGESGSGKTVLGMSLLGLLPESSCPRLEGDLLVDGADMQAIRGRELRDLRRHRLGAVFQDPMTSLDPTMRIGAQLLEVVQSSEAAVRVLGLVGIPDAASRMRSYPHELSGGLRQRVMIAIAIAGEPRLVVADEPTTALDVTVQAQILRLLARLRETLGCSFLLITHDLAVAAQVADRIAVLYGGRLAEVAPTAQILSAPRHPYTAALLRSRLELTTNRGRELPTVEGEPPDPLDLPPGCPFSPRCHFAEPACDSGLPPLEWSERHGDACRRSGELDLPARTSATRPWRRPRLDARAPRALVAEELRVDLGRGRHRVRVLDGIDVELGAGEALALVGASGSGKTTFVRAAAGLVAASGGTVRVAGQPQMVFQDAGASLTPWLSAGEIIADRLRAFGVGRRERRLRTEAVLESVGLPANVAGARPGELSGGQGQRVAIARAVVVPPALLFCDEPTSALDVSVAAGILNLIAGLRRELTMAIVFITHDLAVARLVAERVAVMYSGKVVECGPADAVITSPEHEYTRTLVASLPDLHRETARS